MGKTSKNYYDLLGVLPSATMAELKRAHRVQARRCHPDFNPDDAEAVAQFKDIQAAYDCLKDPPRRTRYDHSIGFKTSDWTVPKSSKRTDDEISSWATSEKPLGPHSEAARAAADEMRQRIHRAEKEGFGLGSQSSRKKQRTQNRPQDRDEDGPKKPPGSPRPRKDGATHSSPHTTQTSTGSAPDPGNPKDPPQGPTAHVPPPHDTARPKNTVPPRKTRPRGPKRTRMGTNKRTQTSQARTIRHRSRLKHLLAAILSWQRSPAITLALLLIFGGMAMASLVLDPSRAAFFAILTVGVLILRKLEEIRRSLEK